MRQDFSSCELPNAIGDDVLHGRQAETELSPDHVHVLTGRVPGPDLGGDLGIRFRFVNAGADPVRVSPNQVVDDLADPAL